ncbi:MAG: hypothetical protein M1457_01025 [bacterium]|nr:hypothetical protein [bacterium]
MEIAVAVGHGDFVEFVAGVVAQRQTQPRHRLLLHLQVGGLARLAPRKDRHLALVGHEGDVRRGGGQPRLADHRRRRQGAFGVV